MGELLSGLGHGWGPPVSPFAWISAACTSVGRDLGAGEWRRHVGTPPENLACDR
ncbi:hypothetical protein [Nonomuraea sp. CA-141351]|uniref:hypothetical protein n=1 Tax=Nonomuraea sp. CA-141351 TaxID=3239996 RepID=UPI003D8B23A9